MLHIAGKDQFVPAVAQQQVIAGLKDIPGVVLHTYPDCDHAFARVGGQHYDKKAADQANKRTADFLRTNLS